MKPIPGAALTYVASAALILVAAPLRAQEDTLRQNATPPTGTGVFGTLVVGGASEGFGGVLSLSVHAGANAFVLRSSATSSFELLSVSDSVEDFALLYGRVRERPSVWYRVAAGPAIVRVVRYGDAYDCWLFACSYDSVESYHAGLALQAEAVWTPAGPFGFGLTGFANLNGEMSYAGLGVGVHVGKVRRS